MTRQCTRCGKTLPSDAAYELWLFHCCRHCTLDSDGRWNDAGTARKWRYFPRWHMTRHPGLPAHVRERHKQRGVVR